MAEGWAEKCDSLKILHSKGAHQDKGAAITTKGAAFTTTKPGVEPISA
jgi:hypothetical protein